MRMHSALCAFLPAQRDWVNIRIHLGNDISTARCKKRSVSLTKKISKAALLSAAYCEEIYPGTPGEADTFEPSAFLTVCFLIKSQDLNVSSHRVWDILVSDWKTLLTIFITCGIKEGVDSDDDPLSWSTFI